MIDRFMRVLNARGGVVDYGIPPPGTLRFSTISLGGSGPWYMDAIRSHDRKLSEWLTLIGEWSNRILPEKYDQSIKESSNPFTTRSSAANFLTELLARELKFRWIARKWVALIRERIYARRVIGKDADLTTTLPVPNYAAVSIRDRRSRSLYVFHAHTLVRSFQSSLHYSIYGIASPCEPKNPYTNVPWSYAQKISIIGQIFAYYCLSHHRYRPVVLESYRRCDVDAVKYFAANKRALQIGGARAFFSDIHNPDLQTIRNEIINDLYFKIGHDVCDGWRVVKTIVGARLVSPELGARWDYLFLATWCFQNYGFTLRFARFDDIIEEFATLHSDTYAWWQSQPKRILTRPPSPNAEEPEIARNIVRL